MRVVPEEPPSRREMLQRLKREVLHQSSDDARRIDVLVDELRGVLRRHAPDVIAYELPSGSRGASQARALGYAHGMIRAVGHGLTMIEITVLDPQLGEPVLHLLPVHHHFH